MKNALKTVVFSLSFIILSVTAQAELTIFANWFLHVKELNRPRKITREEALSRAKGVLDMRYVTPAEKSKTAKIRPYLKDGVVTLPDDTRVKLIIDPVFKPQREYYYDHNGDGLVDRIRREVDRQWYVYINDGTNDAPHYKGGQWMKMPSKAVNAPCADCEKEMRVPTPAEIDEQEALRAITTEVLLVYERFDVYIDSAYYADNDPEIVDFFNLFEPRYILSETLTGWSSEEFYGVKLKINVTSTQGCYGGSAMPGQATIYFSDPLYMSGCEMAYRENGQWLFGNPGELVSCPMNILHNYY